MIINNGCLNFIVFLGISKPPIGLSPLIKLSLRYDLSLSGFQLLNAGISMRSGSSPIQGKYRRSSAIHLEDSPGVQDLLCSESRGFP